MSEKAIFADDGAFFARTIDLPEGLSDADARDFVFAWIENSSPLPMDKMRFGFVRSGPRALVFAGLEERVFGGFDRAALAAADSFLPAFAVLAAGGAPDGVYIVKSEKSFSRVKIEGGAAAEVSALSRESGSEASAAALGNFDGARFLEILSGNPRGRFEFNEYKTIEFSGEASPLSVQLSASARSLADVRDAAALQKMARVRRMAGARAYAFRLVPAVFALLFISQLFIWKKSSARNELAAEYEAVAPKAKLVEGESEKLADLRMFSEKHLHAIGALALVNVARPEDIRFQRSVQTSPFDVQIQGVAPTVGKVHAFVNALSALDGVKSAEQKTEISRGEARFTVNLKLK